MKSQSADPYAVKNAARIYGPAGIAVFVSQTAIAAKAARSRSRTRNARISATGFLWIKNSASKARGRLTGRKNPKRQGRHLTAFLNNYG